MKCSHKRTSQRPLSCLHLQRWGALLLMVVFVCGASASTIDFSDTFSYPDATELNGTNGWGVSGTGSATVTNGEARLINVAWFHRLLMLRESMACVQPCLWPRHGAVARRPSSSMVIMQTMVRIRAK